MTIGFIGQGFIGRAYADDFEERGYDVVRYAAEEQYLSNREKIAECDMVFIAVPTPTTPAGFDFSIVREVLALVGEGKIAVIKSTVLPGTTELLQAEYPKLYLMHSPEFLVAKSALNDARKPLRNIVGYTTRSKDKVDEVLAILPTAPYTQSLPVKEAELVKYMGNLFLAQKVIFANLMYDVSEKLGIDYQMVQEAVGADPRINPSHLAISHDGGRGAGGYCFIKDLAAFADFYARQLPEDTDGIKIFNALEEKNISLLINSKKDLELLSGVYGEFGEK